MKGLGTIVNVAATILGATIGIFIKGGLKENIKEALNKACGISVIFIGIAGAVPGMTTSTEILLLVVSLVIGGIAGELIDIEKRTDRLGTKIQTAVKAKNDSSFVEGFEEAIVGHKVGETFTIDVKFPAGDGRCGIFPVPHWQERRTRLRLPIFFVSSLRKQCR